MSGGMWVPHAARHGWMNGGLRADLLRAIGAVGGMCIWFHFDAVSALRCVHAPAWGHVANAAIRETRQPVAGPSSAVSPACACGWGLRADYSLSGVCVSQADCTRRGFFRLCDDCGCLSIVFFQACACLSGVSQHWLWVLLFVSLCWCLQIACKVIRCSSGGMLVRCSIVQCHSHDHGLSVPAQNVLFAMSELPWCNRCYRTLPEHFFPSQTAWACVDCIALHHIRQSLRRSSRWRQGYQEPANYVVENAMDTVRNMANIMVFELRGVRPECKADQGCWQARADGHGLRKDGRWNRLVDSDEEPHGR